MGPRAEEKLDRRSGKVPNWYLDMSGLKSYWGSQRTYHHTAPVNMNYGCVRRCVCCVRKA